MRLRILFISLVLFSCCKNSNGNLPYYNDASFSPIFISENSYDLNEAITHQIEKFEFLNQDNQPISDKEIDGKIHVANFFFTSCTSICPSMTKNMKNVSREFKNDTMVKILSFSVTPWIDNPKKLKTYSQQYNIENKNWHFLTGSKSEIYRLARMSYFAEKTLGFTKDSTDFLHTEYFILVDKNKNIRGVYNGTLALESKQIVEDIKTLL